MSKIKLTYPQETALGDAYRARNKGQIEGKGNRTMLVLMRLGLVVPTTTEDCWAGQAAWVTTEAGDELHSVMCKQRDPMCISFYSGAMRQCPKCGTPNPHRTYDEEQPTSHGAGVSDA